MCAFLEVLAQSFPAFQLFIELENLCFQESIDIENLQSYLVQFLALLYVLRLDVFYRLAYILTIVVNFGNQTLDIIKLRICLLNHILDLTIFHFEYGLFKIFVSCFHLVYLFFIFVDIVVHIIDFDEDLLLFLLRDDDTV